MLIAIIDYSMGNLGSVRNMFKKIGINSIVVSDADKILNADKILLPGVGAFDGAVKNLQKQGLIEPIRKKVEEGTPILGICLGMQLLTKGSEEGIREGFGFVDAYAKKFDFSKMDKPLPVPHMGWNRLCHEKKSALFLDMPPHERFYFVHSYAVECVNQEDVLTTTNYGYEFVSAFEKGNILGCQFHPEKSHKFGMQLFKNFAERY